MAQEQRVVKRPRPKSTKNVRPKPIPPARVRHLQSLRGQQGIGESRETAYKLGGSIYTRLDKSGRTAMIVCGFYNFAMAESNDILVDARYNVIIHWATKHKQWYITIHGTNYNCPIGFDLPELAVAYLALTYCPFQIGTRGVE